MLLAVDPTSLPAPWLQEPTAPQLVRSSPTVSTGKRSSKSSKHGVASRLADGLAALKERLPRWTKK